MFVIEAYIVLTGIGAAAFWMLTATGTDRKVVRHEAPEVTPLAEAA
jgi:hypothetical protein